MRNLIAALIAWLLPARGKRRATSTPSVRRISHPLPLPPVPYSEEVIDADRLPLVRPYLLALEREWERELQWQRRTAAALATFGVDYPYGPQGGAA